MFFGQKLSELRLLHAEMGLRKFANMCHMLPSEYNEIECGRVPPPKCKKWIQNIALQIGLEQNSSEYKELYYLWSEPFVMQKMSEDVIAGFFLPKSDGTLLSEEECIELNNSIISRRKEHNKKADKYNEEHNGL